MTSRTSNPPRGPTSERPRGDQPVPAVDLVTRLRTIDETAELLNVSSRTVRRLIEFGCPSGAPARAPRSHCRREILRCSSPRIAASERWPLQSPRGLICHIFSDYREYSMQEEIPSVL